MPKPVVQWLLFKYIDGEITFLEAIQNETARGESALEISGARAEEDCAWCGFGLCLVYNSIDKSIFSNSWG